MQKQDKRLVIVDVDNTLLPPHLDCTISYLKYFSIYHKHLRKNFLVRKTVLSAMNPLLKFFLPKRISHISRRALGTLLLFFGLNYYELLKFSLDVWKNFIIKNLRRRTLKLIKNLQSKNIAVVSSSPKVAIFPLKDLIGAKIIVGTEFFITKHGTIIGIKKLVHKYNKLIILSRFLKDLKKAIYITDKSEKGIWDPYVNEVFYIDGITYSIKK